MAKTYENAEAVEALANVLIPTHHPHLATARIRYVFVDKASTKGGKITAASATKITGVNQFLLDLDFVVMVALDQWNPMTAEQRTALVDHELEHCFGEEDPEDPGATMKWSMRSHDVQEFSSILRRHGAWNEDLQGFTEIASQIDIADFDEPEQTEATQERQESHG